MTFLTIPVSRPRGNEGKASYPEVDFADTRWRKKHPKTVEHSYGRSSHFAEVYALYRRELERGETFVGL